jgi:hypothetical protein
MDIDWIIDLSPDEARAALDALNAHQAPISGREAAEAETGARGQGGRTVVAPSMPRLPAACGDRPTARHCESRLLGAPRAYGSVTALSCVLSESLAYASVRRTTGIGTIVGLQHSFDVALRLQQQSR